MREKVAECLTFVNDEGPVMRGENTRNTHPYKPKKGFRLSNPHPL